MTVELRNAVRDAIAAYPGNLSDEELVADLADAEARESNARESWEDVMSEVSVLTTEQLRRTRSKSEELLK